MAQSLYFQYTCLQLSIGIDKYEHVVLSIYLFIFKKGSTYTYLAAN